MSAQLRIALIASLILNVFLVGIGIGVLVTGVRLTPGQPPQQQRRFAPNAWMAAEALPPAERIKFRQMLRDRATAVQPELKSVRLARREAIALMSQPNYDPKAAGEALKRAREGELHAREEIDAAVVDYLTKLTPEQRTAVAEAMVRNRGGMRGLGGGHGGPPDGGPPPPGDAPPKP